MIYRVLKKGLIRWKEGGDMTSCLECVCKYCLYWWSSRCPYGDCYDDYRAAVNPYDAAHPAKPLRTHWSNWDQPGEQAHWCRGGEFYPSTDCEYFIQYEGQRVSDCYRAVVSEFQDGYIDCSVREAMSCEACMKDMAEKLGKADNSSGITLKKEVGYEI